MVGNFEQVVSDREKLDLPFGFPDRGGEFFLHVHDLADIGLGKFKCSDEVLFRDFISSALNHHYLFRATDIYQIQIALLALAVSRIYNEFTVDSPDAHGADWSGKRDIRDTKSSRGTGNAKNIRIILAVRTEQDTDHLGIIKIAFGKQRAKRTVRHSRS